jgi:hypothetical protein
MASSAPMPSNLPPQLIIAWLPTRDVGAALRVSKDWCAAPEPIFKAIAGRHGLRRVEPSLMETLQRVEPSWRETVRQYREDLGSPSRPSGLGFFSAAQRDDASAIQRYISEGYDVNHVGCLGRTALHIAAMWGNLDALNALIAAGADLNAQNWIERTANCGGTPLHVAANSDKVPLTERYHFAERLIEAGANARLLNGEEEAPYESEFPDCPTTLDSSSYRPRFRKLLEDAYRAQRE